MKSNQEVLTSILKTTQMGQVGIRCVLESAMNPGIRKALESQLREYDCIESEAYRLASQRGWELSDIQPIVKTMSTMMTRAKLKGGNTDSKIAGMMIQGNTRGVITGLKMQHQWPGKDTQIGFLSQKLLDCENANIRQMQQYL